MICPNCSYEIESGTTCANCGVDSVLFNKTNKMSNSLYNRGLSQAKSNDLSGAIDSLTKSIEFNKTNVGARNLLGLIYFQVGHIGDALKHWVISTSLSKDKNVASHYLALVQKNSRTLEKYNDAVKMYNFALDYLQQKSDDMAIIQLKKAVEINANFVDAMNLLTLCYFIQKDKEKAMQLVERVLTIDSTNEIAISYFKELNPTKVRPDPILKIQKTVKPTYSAITPKDKKNFINSFALSDLLYFGAGFVCAFAILFILVVPGMNAKSAETLKTTQDELATTKIDLITKTAELEQQILEVNADKAKLLEENTSFNAESNVMAKTQEIQTAQTLFTAGSFEEAAAILSALDATGLPAETVIEADNLKVLVYPEAAKLFYDNAILQFNASDYENAKILFNKSLLFAKNDVDYMDSIIYSLAFIAEETQDIPTAKAGYQQLINEFPNSKLKTKATNRLNSLE